MWIEYFSYIAAFIISAGMSALGVLISYQMFQIHKKPVLGILLYYQIFLYSFLIYGIWGNIALRGIISDMSLNTELAGKLAFFIPMIGIPFMVVSWFMLIKFGFNLNGFKLSRVFVYAYFPVILTLIITLSILIQKEIIVIPWNPDLFIVRIIIALNIIVHIFFLLPFILRKQDTPLVKETGFNRKWAMINFGGVILYSLFMSFFDIYGFITTCLAIILLFASCTIIPLRIKINNISTENPEGENMDFHAFCKFYEISKREAEIILEICSGKSNKAISEKLYITLQTVKDHNHRIYTKTGVKNRVQLANMVREKTGT